jgi:hypothetical protein
MKKLIITDPVRICGSDLASGTLDEKRKCMGYDIKRYQIQRALASACMLCPFPKYYHVFQSSICSVSEDPHDYCSVSKGPDDYCYLKVWTSIVLLSETCPDIRKEYIG